MRSNNILVIAKSNEIRLELLNNFPKEAFEGKVTIREPRSRPMPFNSVTITNVSFELEDEYILQKLIESNSAVKHVERLVNKNKQPTKTIKIDFNSAEAKNRVLNHGISIGYFHYKARDFTPAQPQLLQCYKCLKYGHTSSNCTGDEKCNTCSGPHNHKDCSKPKEEAKCLNCSGDHAASSMLCPRRLKLKEDLRQRSLSRSRDPSQNRFAAPWNMGTKRDTASTNTENTKPEHQGIHLTSEKLLVIVIQCAYELYRTDNLSDVANRICQTTDRILGTSTQPEKIYKFLTHSGISLPVKKVKGSQNLQPSDGLNDAGVGGSKVRATSSSQNLLASDIGLGRGASGSSKKPNKAKSQPSAKPKNG